MKKTVLFLLPLLVFISCGKELETVTVKSDARDLLRAPSDSAFNVPDPESDDFVQVRLGEIAKVESLDPLYASSNSEFRTTNLLYEGLTSLNSLGSPSPGLAKSWDVNSDSTRFIFNLRTNVYFHDSSVFEAGNGRRFRASDVSYIFKRMTDNNVPDFAADHFKDIRGFSAYHNEQTYIKDPTKRVLTSIEGIVVRNDSTIIFHMTKPASDFLERLAHPMAAIYAKESVPTIGPIQKAAGTGQFSFIKKEGNAFLLTTNNDYRGFVPPISRLDIVSGLSEKDLYQQFAQGNLDALIELGISTLLTVADSTGNLTPSFANQYMLSKSAVSSSYDFYYNTSARQHTQVNNFLGVLQSQNFLQNNAIGTLTAYQADSTSTDNTDSRQLVISQTEHPYELFLLNKLAPKATEANYSFSMNASYAIADNVTFSTRPYPGTKKILSWKAPIYILSNNRVSGLEVKNEPWKLSLTSINVSGIN
jgi:ABC-type transport system substrate-binding protein